MATFKQNCPHCQSELELENQWIGMEAECPECQRSFKVNPPAQSAPKRQLPPPGAPKHNMPMGSPFAPPVSAPPPPMMNQLTADEYLYIRNRKIMNFFTIVCILLSIASATFGCINALDDQSLSSNYTLQHVKSYEDRKQKIGSQLSESWYYELMHDENMTIRDTEFYTLSTAEAMIFDSMNYSFNRLRGRVSVINDCIFLFSCSVVFMLLAIFLKLHQILGALTLKARR
ncbi:MAG: hypothetical protein E7053_03290 [Lentisphaerae bacterium]|nr:hypothetical protein [Lentisphaerota bacterium]